MIRIGLMGCGTVADYGHLPAIKRTAGLELVSLFDPVPARLAAARAKFDAPRAFADVDEFFRSPIDAVVVASPAPAHAHNVLAAARARKPVLCEKPLAMSDDEGRQMIEAMRAAGVPLFVGFTLRFGAPEREIKRLIADGAVGRVRSLRLVYLWDCHGKYEPRDDPTCPNPRRLGRMREGGPLVDCGVHKIDLARWWLGSEVTSARGVGAWVDEYDAPDHAYLHMDHACGAHTMIETSFTYGHTTRDRRTELSYDVIGTDGLIRYDLATSTFELLDKSGTRPLPWHAGKNFDAMHEEFERALRTSAPGDMPTAEDGLIATRIARRVTEGIVRDKLERSRR